MRVLGLDASTTTIGLAVIDTDPLKLVHCEFYKPPKKGSLFKRLKAVQIYITDMLNKYQPDEVAIEDIILFMKGKSTAKTITSLAIFNRFVGFTVTEVLGKEPHLLNVMRIRHSLKLTKKLPDKKEMPDLAAHHLGISFPWQYGKKGKLLEENFDVGDSISVVLAYLKGKK